MVVARITDPREDDLPPVGLLTLVDPETGQVRDVQTASRRFRARYEAAAAERRTSAAASVRGAGAGLLDVATDRDWLLDVVAFVVAKRKRR